MALIKSIVAGAGASLLLANVVHTEEGGDGGLLQISDVTIADHRIAWSWSVFVVVTVLVWLLGKVIDFTRVR